MQTDRTADRIMDLVRDYAERPAWAEDRAEVEAEIRREIAALLQPPSPELDEAALARAIERDAARYRWLAAYCRSTVDRVNDRWSIIVDGPLPTRHDDEDAFDAAIDAAMREHDEGAAR